MVHERVIVLAFSGGGSVPSIQRVRPSCPYILFISERRALSLAPAKYPVRVTNPMAQRMARMVITTMSSMRVKACEFTTFPLIFFNIRNLERIKKYYA